ncbi:MAG: four helix bundle protein [Balneolaceae bacterium]
MDIKRFDLEGRLIDFAVAIIKFVTALPNNRITYHFSVQLIRSGTSPALNYAESQSAESRKDFIHKMSIALKELRESLVNLKILQRSGMAKDHSDIDQIINECNQLISIFVKSINTAKMPKS